MMCALGAVVVAAALTRVAHDATVSSDSIASKHHEISIDSASSNIPALALPRVLRLPPPPPPQQSDAAPSATYAPVATDDAPDLGERQSPPVARSLSAMRGRTEPVLQTETASVLKLEAIDGKPPRVRASDAAPYPAPYPAPSEAGPAPAPQTYRRASMPSAKTPETLAAAIETLRRIERGRGPGIHINWPPSPDGRRRLAEQLVRCHGMLTVLVGEDGFWRPEGRGAPWHFLPAVHSGFFRTVAEETLGPGERGAIARARQRPGYEAASVRRVFPRRQDIALLGGLARLVGGALTDRAAVSAAYAFTPSGGVSVGSVEVDGRAYPGLFSLPTEPGCRA